MANEQGGNIGERTETTNYKRKNVKQRGKQMLPAGRVDEAAGAPWQVRFVRSNVYSSTQNVFFVVSAVSISSARPLDFRWMFDFVVFPLFFSCFISRR